MKHFSGSRSRGDNLFFDAHGQVRKLTFVFKSINFYSSWIISSRHMQSDRVEEMKLDAVCPWTSRSNGSMDVKLKELRAHTLTFYSDFYFRLSKGWLATFQSYVSRFRLEERILFPIRMGWIRCQNSQDSSCADVSKSIKMKQRQAWDSIERQPRLL